MASNDQPNSNQTPMEKQDLTENLFSDPKEEPLITVPGAILHLIDKHYSVELATGDLKIFRLLQGDNTVVVFASVSDDIQWPLTKDLAAVKLDSAHYFFSFRAPPSDDSDSSSDEDEKKAKKKKGKKKKKKKKGETELLSYGLTIVSMELDVSLKDLDMIMEMFSNFSVRKMEEVEVVAVAGEAAREITAGELKEDKKKKEEIEGKCAAYWTTLAPNVEEYSGTAAKLIATGSGQLVKGILWCGDVTVERMMWGNEILKERMGPGDGSEIDPRTLKRMKRVKNVTVMTEKVATGVLSGVVKVSGFFSSSVRSKVGKKLVRYLPEEVVAASLDSLSRICEAVEVSGKSVMSTSSTVTTELVSQRYGEEAGKVTSEGLDAAGHAVGTAWAVIKTRNGIDPKSSLMPSALAKSVADEVKKDGAKKKDKVKKKDAK